MNLLINTDGGARGNPGPAGIGIVVREEAGQELYEHAEAIGETTNNVAEYKALEHAVDWLTAYEDLNLVEQVTFRLDSKLVIEQVQGNWKIKQPHLLPLVNYIQSQIAALPCSVSFTYVPRIENAAADALVNQALDAAMDEAK